MTENKVKLDTVCPRCGGTEVYKVIEREEKDSPFWHIKPTCYTACLTVDQFGNRCWYHLKAARARRRNELTPKKCKVEGCQNTEFVYGRMICTEHYNARCLERYHRKRQAQKASRAIKCA